MYCSSLKVKPMLAFFIVGERYAESEIIEKPSNAGRLRKRARFALRLPLSRPAIEGFYLGALMAGQSRRAIATANIIAIAPPRGSAPRMAARRRYSSTVVNRAVDSHDVYGVTFRSHTAKHRTPRAVDNRLILGGRKPSVLHALKHGESNHRRA